MNQQKHTYCCRRASADIAYKQLKDVATTCILRAVNAPKCVCVRGPGQIAPDPAEGAYSAPPDLEGFGEIEWGRDGMERGRERKGREETESKEEGRSTPNKNSGYGLAEIQ